MTIYEMSVEQLKSEYAIRTYQENGRWFARYIGRYEGLVGQDKSERYAVIRLLGQDTPE